MYSGNRINPDPEGAKQMSGLHAGWGRPFGPRGIETALRRLGMRRRHSREDHSPRDELEQLKD